MYLRDPIYLSGAAGRRTRRFSPLRQIANVLFVALVIGVNYLVFFHDDTVPPPPVLDGKGETDTLPDTDPAPATRPAGPEQPPTPASPTEPTAVARKFEGRLNRGDTVFNALMSEGLENGAVTPVLSAMTEVFDFRKAQVGNHFSGTVDPNGRVLSFEYSTGPLDTFTVTMKDDQYVATKKDVPVDRRTATLGCTIGNSLFASITRCGESPELAAMFTELFAFDVDFFQEIREGDVVRLIVDKVYIDGRFLKYDTIRAASFEGKFGTYTAFGYKQEDGTESYFTESGTALKKEFLKTPLKYTRISSGYTHSRFHPTLHKWKRHLAIDYAAPINTPVQAVATGTVKFVGKKGASGNLVAIDHAGGTTSYYAHLNKFGHIAVGDTVTQRSVIGYVGQTGRATGPHLHFALKQKGAWVNPLEVKFTAASPVSAGEKARFDAAIAPLVETLRKVKVQGLSERQG